MIKVNIHDVKTNLSRYLAELEPGEALIICRRNEPVAELRLLPAKRHQPRPVGLARGQVEVSEAFFEPLPADLLDAFEGDS